MHPHVAALSISALMVLAGTALSCFGGPHEATAEAASTDAHAAMAGGHGAGAHDYEGGKGTIPSSADATKMERRSRIVIEDDAGFNPANGVRSGSGTFDDPFVISDWFVDQIYIHDTTAAFEIRENFVGDIMILDWTGPGGYVHHNHINNLRTNRNVERFGDPSATVIEGNRIFEVEELRHFDGIVRNNTIGREPLLDLIDLGPDVVFNIAGLNGAGIHDNVILGGVDMKIHGHHHSDATGAHSHNHGKPDATQKEDHVEDHQTRYVDFLFYNNTIKDNGFGLRYNDLNHAGDDRTATSENEPDLEKPHVHHTRVALVNNLIEGATLRVAIMNSNDERHVPGQSGELILAKNRIVKPNAGDGIVVQDVTDAKVLVEGNRVEESELPLLSDKRAAILFARFSNSSIVVRENALGAYTYGIRAAQFDANTTWSVEDNDAPGVEYPVYWDDSVANAPEGSEEHGSHEHGHEDDVAAPAFLRRLGL